MRTQIRLLVAAVVLALAAACANATDPLACTGNPKCKADANPKPPTNLQPLQVTP